MHLIARRTCLALLTGVAALLAAPPDHQTQNVIFVMTDGYRWQELFRGADPALLNKENGSVGDVAALKKRYWRDTPHARREALMPFLWSVIAKQGQIYGNRDLGSDAYVTNGLNFSYPGYQETLCGFPDPRINSNDKNLNPNVSVLEWLAKKPAFHGKIAAFGAWDAFPFILNVPRSGLLVNAGYAPLTAIPLTPKLELLNALKAEGPRVWDEEPFDSITFHTALEYLKTAKPRVMYISFDETDEWAHKGDYTEYLNAAHRVDGYLKELWDFVQSDPQYRGQTTLIFSPDHGRGEAPVEWKNHGEKNPDSKYIWMAFLGPDTQALGERSKVGAVTQSQIATRLAAFLGEDYAAATEKVGRAVAQALRPAR